MPSRRIEHQIDELLLATSMATGSLYVRRRVRRMLAGVGVGAVVVAAAAGSVLVIGGALAYYRSRAASRANRH